MNTHRLKRTASLLAVVAAIATSYAPAAIGAAGAWTLAAA